MLGTQNLGKGLLKSQVQPEKILQGKTKTNTHNQHAPCS